MSQLHFIIAMKTVENQSASMTYLEVRAGKGLGFRREKVHKQGGRGGNSCWYNGVYIYIYISLQN